MAALDFERKCPKTFHKAIVKILRFGKEILVRLRLKKEKKDPRRGHNTPLTQQPPAAIV